MRPAIADAQRRLNVIVQRHAWRHVEHDVLLALRTVEHWRTWGNLATVAEERVLEAAPALRGRPVLPALPTVLLAPEIAELTEALLQRPFGDGTRIPQRLRAAGEAIVGRPLTKRAWWPVRGDLESKADRVPSVPLWVRGDLEREGRWCGHPGSPHRRSRPRNRDAQHNSCSSAYPLRRFTET